MYTPCLTIFVLFFYFSNADYLFKKSKYIQEITHSENFSLLHKSPHSLLVFFYNESPENEDYVSEFENAAESLHNIQLSVAINCDLLAKVATGALNICKYVARSYCFKFFNPSYLFSHYKVTTFPSIVILKPRELEEVNVMNIKLHLRKPFKYSGI